MDKFILPLLLAVCLALAGCQDQPQTGGSAPATGSNQEAEKPADPAQTSTAPDLQAELAHHNFVFKSIDGGDLPDTGPDGARRERPNLSFSEWPQADGRICNSFRGRVELEGRKLTMKDAATTMMLCDDPKINDLESTFHMMMNAGAEVEFNQGTLTLTGSGHSIVLTLLDHVN